MQNILSNLSLKTKLLFMMVSLCFLTIASLFVLYNRAEKDLIDEVRHNTEELSTAIQISIEQMSKTKETQLGELKDLTRLKKKGIKEISVINNVREVIASSNARLIGRKLQVKGESFKNIGNVTEYTTTTGGQKRYDILLPVVIGKERLGYIHIATEFDDFTNIARKNHLTRLIATIGIFTIGILVALYLSKKYTKPIQSLAEAAHRVASGDLSVNLDIDEVDTEIGRLTRNFNDMVRKLSENRALEVRLKEAEHLSKIGTLASGIAHEIRNPLNLINLSIDHLWAANAPEDPGKKENFLATISNIKSEIKRLDEMISSFLNFGKPLKLTLNDLTVGAVVDETALLLSESCSEQKISLKVTRQPVEPNVMADYKHIKTCFVNLFLNAMQSMPGGGSLTAEVSSNNGFVSIKVEDTGCGIPPENFQKIFDPYFTTKDVGIGLGLALTKRIVEEHGGRISVRSVMNKGTAVTINLPVANPAQGENG